MAGAITNRIISLAITDRIFFAGDQLPPLPTASDVLGRMPKAEEEEWNQGRQKENDQAPIPR